MHPAAMRDAFWAGQRQRGQAAVFSLLLLVGVLVSAALLYNSGRLSLTKTHLQNTADSAAYSGAILVARDENFSSYSNRAMVANQVAIAQMVGLRSWSRYYCMLYNDQCGNQTSTNQLPSQIVSTVQSSSMSSFYSTLLNTVYKNLSSALFKTNKTFDGKLADLANLINDALSPASFVYHSGVVAEIAAGAGGAGLIADVVKANDPSARISTYGRFMLGADAASLNSFTRTYGHTTTGKKRFANVVINGLDAFSQGRSSSETLPYPLVDFYSFIPYNDQPFSLIWVNYTGGTEFKTNDQAWSSMDVASIDGFSIFWISVFGVPVPLILPVWDTNPWLYFWPTDMSRGAALIGSGQSTALDQTNNFGPSSTAPFGASYTNNAVPANDQYSAGTGSSIAHYDGLRPYQDVATTSGANASDWAAPDITVVIARPQGTVETTQQVGVDSGQLALTDSEPTNQVEAMASAQSHFVRPRSARLLGGHVVYGNLFNPYWEAHLVATPTAIGAGARTAQIAGAG